MTILLYNLVQFSFAIIVWWTPIKEVIKYKHYRLDQIRINNPYSVDIFNTRLFIKIIGVS